MRSKIRGKNVAPHDVGARFLIVPTEHIADGHVNNGVLVNGRPLIVPNTGFIFAVHLASVCSSKHVPNSSSFTSESSTLPEISLSCNGVVSETEGAAYKFDQE